MCKRLAGEGTKVSFIGKLGDDDNGRAYRENFKQCGIETSYVYIQLCQSTWKS